MESPNLYKKEENKDKITLSNEERDRIKAITLGLEEVDETVRSLALEDVIKTLENGHPLNRIIKKDDNIEGYIACEDFIPKEAYIKYLGTTKQTGRNLLSEIPAFLEFAKEKGYTKINFHGWNERLNNILTRYGFEKIRTDKMLAQGIDFYEKNLTEDKNEQEVNQERMNAFEQKYINQINKLYEQTLKTFKEEDLEEKQKLITNTYSSLSSRLQSQDNYIFGDRQKAILKLKLARYFQNNDSIDTNVLFDAIIETPKFLDTDKGGFHRLFEVHIQKTIQKTAELRKKRAEQIGENDLNPYEALFQTKSGHYYMARLLNMPHLEDESLNMGTSCVGTSDHYYKEILKGNIEILSFRKIPEINKDKNKLEGDIPVITIEYNLKTKVIEQMKKYDDGYLSSSDPFFNDVVDALKQLRNTETDTGEKRDFKKINNSELENFKVQDYHLLTENGEVSFKDFDLDSNTFVLKMGNMNITPEIPKNDAVKIFEIVEGIKINEEELALDPTEITENTKAYIGPLNEKDIFKKLKNIEYVYTDFPNNRIKHMEYKKDIKYPKNLQEWLDTFKERNINLEDSSINKMLEKMETSELSPNQEFIQLTVADLFGDTKNHKYEDICNKAEELGLELCEQDDGPKLRISTEQNPADWYRTAMKSIDVGERLRIWCVGRYGDGQVILRWSYGEPDYEYISDV